jgi:hypothetical protein
MKKRIFYIGLFSCLLHPLFGKAQVQDTSINLSFASFFELLSPSALYTGFLINKTIDYAAIHRFNGQESDSSSSANHYWELYNELAQAQLSAILTNNVIARKEETEKLFKTSSIIPIGGFNLNYQEFNKADLEAGRMLFNASINKFYENPNGLMHYSSYSVIAVSPLIQETKVKQCQFKLDEQHFIQAASKEKINYLEINFDDGLGWRKVTWNAIINVNYTSSGTKTLRIKSFTNKASYSSSAKLVVNDPNLQLAPLPTTSIDITASEAFDGVRATGSIGIWKACNPTKGINQPVLIVEGFDPLNNRKLDDVYHDGNDDNLYFIGNSLVANKTNILDSLRAYGHDIIILDFADGGRKIQENAMVAVEAINYINAHKEGNDEIVIIGPSMGTMVSKYALAFMEKYNMAHHCRLWVAFDGPLKGANVPLSFQHFVNFLHNSLSLLPLLTQASVAHLKTNLLDCTAARQMLLYHYSQTSMGLAHPDPSFVALQNSFQNDFINNGYPSQCRKVAVADGSGFGIDQGYSPNAVLNQIRLFFPSPLGINLFATSRALPNNSSQYANIFNGYFQMSIGTVPVSFNLRSVNLHFVNPLDNCPAGTQGFHNMMHDFLFNATGIGNSPVFFTEPKLDGFIPTISSLDLNNTANYHFNVSTVAPQTSYKHNFSSFISPFDAFIYNNQYVIPNTVEVLNNAPHVVKGLTPDFYDFAMKEIMPRNWCLQNESYASNRDFEAVSISAGNNVTNIRAKGNYTIQNGASVEMKAESRIAWKNGFSAKKGSNVHAFIESGIYDNSCIHQFPFQFRLNQTADESIPNTLPINSSEIDRIGIRIQPNPAHTVCKISWDKYDQEDLVNIEIYDTKKQLVLAAHSQNASTVDLNVSDLASGLYFVHLISAKYHQTKKLIIQ